jgi:putative oxidoreductase
LVGALGPFGPRAGREHRKHRGRAGQRHHGSNENAAASISFPRGVGLRARRESPRAREPKTQSAVCTGMKQIQRLIDFLLNPPLSAPRSVLIVRLMAGGVFLSEGILKFVYTNQGVGRFTKLGIPAPELTANFVGGLEIVGGLLLIAGLFTRAIAVPFIIEMVVAILTTKIALYLGTSPLPLPPAPPKVGFWAVMHETRSDYAQILTSIFLLIVGPGSWSLDSLLRRRRDAAIAPQLSGGPHLLPNLGPLPPSRV